MRLSVAAALLLAASVLEAPARVEAHHCNRNCQIKFGAAFGSPKMPVSGDANAQSLQALPTGETQPAVVHSPVSVDASVGWRNRYRAAGAWSPVHVGLHNAGAAEINGEVAIPTASITDSLVAQKNDDTLYTQQVVLPAGATKSIVIHIPGPAVSNQLTVQFRSGGRLMASQTLFPVALDNADITIGALTSDPTTLTWISRAHVPGGTITPVELQPSDLDPSPEALSTFDVVVLTNDDSSQFDNDQIGALRSYVREGGTLLEVGGPDWQRTLRPLPADLVPGRVRGTITTNNLSGLRFFGAGMPPRTATTISLTTDPAGSVVTGPNGVPLVIRHEFGVGRLEYLAFDPSGPPFFGWRGASPLLSQLLTAAAPYAMRRLSLPDGFDPLSFRDPGSGRLDPAATMLDLPVPFTTGLPVAASLLIILLALYVLTLGPVAYAVVRRTRRIAVGWGLSPLLAVAIALAVIGSNAGSSRPSAVLDAIGAVRLDGSGASVPADTYLLVHALQSGTHSVGADASGIPASVPIASSNPGQSQDGVRSRWVLNSGAATTLTLPDMPAATSQVVRLRTTYAIQGSIQEHLTLDRSGAIVGRIYNGTDIHLVHAAIVAGQVIERLPVLRPGESVRVHVVPHVDVTRNNYDSPLFRLYGSLRGPDGRRLRDSVNLLPDVSAIGMTGEVLLLGWTADPLVHLTLDNKSQQTSFHLIVKPLRVGFPGGTFHLRSGTLGAYPLDERPVTPNYACCDPSVQGIFMGGGASATFEFDLPRGSELHADHLTLAAFAGGADTTYNGYTDMPPHAASVYNWRTGAWEPLVFRHGQSALRSPDTLISGTGAMLVRIVASSHTGDLAVFDPHHDLQLSGVLTVSPGTHRSK